MSRRVLATLALLILLVFLLTWGGPWLRTAVRLVRLVRETPARVLPVPVEGVGPESLAEGWGSPRSGGRRHEGIDIFAPRGALVVSATRGVIVRKGWNNLGGWSVTVLGPGGEHHYYAHLDEFAPPEVGDWVDVGEVLGFVGDTGNARGTPTHLHYGIYAWTGRATDPYPRLAPGGSGSPRATPPPPPRQVGGGQGDPGEERGRLLGGPAGGLLLLDPHRLGEKRC